MSCEVALVAVGLGYVVLLQANKEKGTLKTLGQAIALLIMLGAMLSAVSNSACMSMGGSCPMIKEAPMCHVKLKT